MMKVDQVQSNASDQKPRWKMVEKMAEEVLNANYVTAPPVPVNAIAESYGFKVLDVEFPSEHEGVAGYIILPERLILLNKDDSANRKAFTVAHELGHFILHKSELEAASSLGVLARRPVGSNETNPLEKEANWFASRLLVPDFLLAKYKDEAPHDIARIFGVSLDVIGYRLGARK